MENKNCILVAGAESSGTRIFSKLLSRHPSIKGSTDVLNHDDLLDKVWLGIHNKNPKNIFESIPKDFEEKYLLTRRSMPHGLKPGVAAEFMKFPDINAFCFYLYKLQYKITFLITTRSVVPNLISCVENRASSKTFHDAYRQYHACYKKIFKVIEFYKFDYFILSLEALLLDKGLYVNSIFDLLELEHICFDDKIIKSDVNILKYKSF